MTDQDQIDLPDYVASFSKLAAVLEIGRSQLHEIRLRDKRFPEITQSGWVVQEVRDFLFLRRLEKMSDADFEAVCQQVENEPFDPEYFFGPEGARLMIADIRRGGLAAYIKEMKGQR